MRGEADALDADLCAGSDRLQAVERITGSMIRECRIAVAMALYESLVFDVLLGWPCGPVTEAEEDVVGAHDGPAVQND